MRNLTVAALLLTAALTACHSRTTPQEQAPASTPARAEVVVSAARLVLPVVAGHPAAAYFTLVNRGQAPAELKSVSIAGAASVELHETSGGSMNALASVPIRAGGSVIFAPGGKHAMVFSLAPSLKPGATGQITLHFGDGGTITAPLRVEAPAPVDDGMAGMGDMAGMKM